MVAELGIRVGAWSEASWELRQLALVWLQMAWCCALLPRRVLQCLTLLQQRRCWGWGPNRLACEAKQ